MAAPTSNTKVTSIDQFISGFNGGTRLNRFEVTSSCLDYNRPYHIRAAQIPGAYISAIGLNYFGRTIELPGERVYQPWQVTILDDTGSQKVYDNFKKWQHNIGNRDLKTYVNIDEAFTCNFTVKQYKTDSDTVEKSFTLFNVWPIQVGPIELDMSKDNQLCQFTVTFAYSHFDYNPV